MRGFMSVRLAACCFALLTSQANAQVVINFDSLPGVPCYCGGPVPLASFVNNQFLPLGVYFNSSGESPDGAPANPVSPPNTTYPDEPRTDLGLR